MIAEYFANMPYGFAKGIFDFFYVWYFQGTIDFWNKEISFLRGVERDVGFTIHIRHIRDPLFGDDDFMGRFIGIFFRLGFILFGFFVTSASIIFVVGLYAIWLVFPPVVFLMIFANLFFVS